MLEPRVELAVLNNVYWYETIFSAHGLAWAVDGRVWMSQQPPPPFHSNLVVISPMVTQQEIEMYVHNLDEDHRLGGWSMKDSYASFDLTTLGFEELFRAHWIWREPTPIAADQADPEITWSSVETSAQLLEWEAAWRGDAENGSAANQPCQFPPQLLANRGFAFFMGRRHDTIVAGGIANWSPGVLGLSNVFYHDAAAIDVWAGLIRLSNSHFPNRPIVGYERGDDLLSAQQAGFTPIGPLTVWNRPG